MVSAHSFDDNRANLTRCRSGISQYNLLLGHVAKSKKIRERTSDLRLVEILILALGTQPDSGLRNDENNSRLHKPHSKTQGIDSTVADASKEPNIDPMRQRAKRSAGAIYKSQSIGSVFELSTVTNSGLMPGNVLVQHR